MVPSVAAWAGSGGSTGLALGKPVRQKMASQCVYTRPLNPGDQFEQVGPKETPRDHFGKVGQGVTLVTDLGSLAQKQPLVNNLACWPGSDSG